MASPTAPSSRGQAKTRYSCRPCRSRKIKCNGIQPICSTCEAHERHCEYDADGPRRRSRVPGSRRAQRELRRSLRGDSGSVGEPSIVSEQDCNSAAHPLSQEAVRPSPRASLPRSNLTSPSSGAREALQPTQADAQDQLDVTEHLAVDPSGKVEARGPTNTLYEALSRRGMKHEAVPDHYASAILTANAALEEQKEASYKQALLERGYIEGVPAELALHLIDIHWSRHHFFLITYRPTFYRDMMNKGPHYSPLLLFAILAVSSRYSERSEVGGGDHSAHSGKAFYDKAKQLLADEMDKSTIPTATALLLMGNALGPAGQVDKGWLYTGMGIRMIMNLGLHLDSNDLTSDPTRKKTLEEVEIRRRLFWGAFISEKLQSLYLGRPFSIHERDVHVPKKFLDVYEEGQAWKPLPEHHGSHPLEFMSANSISTFANMCTLAEICGDIMSSFFAVKAKSEAREKLHASRDRLRYRLAEWHRDLPGPIRYAPWEEASKHKTVPIHVFLLHTIYLSLVILLERPFVANGHLSTSGDDIGSWGECTIAAEKIAHLLYAYRRVYSFRRIPYQLCYTTYVASTILVRNVKQDSEASTHIKHLAVCLKAFEEMKLQHPGSSHMLSIIRSLMTRLSVDVDDQFLETISTSPQRPETLPSPDFETSNTDAIYNRNIDIDAIRQTFAHSPATQVITYPTETSQVAPSFQAPEVLQPLTDAIGPEVDYGAMDYSYAADNGWQMPLTNFDDDLLFGVLGGNWP